MRTDIKKDRKDLYLPGRADFTEVDVPANDLLGHRTATETPTPPPAYATAIQALYAGAYAIRAVLKKRTGDGLRRRPPGGSVDERRQRGLRRR